ncbi:unnamed protein product [Didymodactylos carnosus]|uniref:Helix-turn-helix domain-containing protein n=1 Tax=Didymodactylos carnosus TaxID=1234261 RepID=A0A8S2F6N5_9BILA|nr:unnamed protein product [Didymodactylos carnosus]CAF4182311.1 unnamed protein product [Didymodactylos carnosus]
MTASLGRKIQGEMLRNEHCFIKIESCSGATFENRYPYLSITQWLESNDSMRACRQCESCLIIAGISDIYGQSIEQIMAKLNILIATLRYKYRSVQRVYVHEIINRIKPCWQQQTREAMMNEFFVNITKDYMTWHIHTLYSGGSRHKRRDLKNDGVHLNGTGVLKLVQTIKETFSRYSRVDATNKTPSQEYEGKFRSNNEAGACHSHHSMYGLLPQPTNTAISLTSSQKMILRKDPRQTDKSKVLNIDLPQNYEKKSDIYMARTDAYMEINEHPLKRMIESTNLWLTDLLSKKRISKTVYEKLKSPQDCELPHLYYNPKDHKPGAPLRPIVAQIKSPVARISHFLDKTLRPIFEQHTAHYTLQNTDAFLNHLERLRPEQLEDRLKFYNEKDPYIKLTYEIGKTANSLYVTIFVRCKTARTIVNRKPAAQPYVLPYDSIHPRHIIKNISYAAYIRAIRICSDIADCLRRRS